MEFPKPIWEQLKNITVERLIVALERDGWVKDSTFKQAHVYYNPKNGIRITLHYHPGKTYRNPRVLKLILNDIG